MTKLLISKATEANTIATVLDMATESLDPKNYENLVIALKQLCKTRNINKAVIPEDMPGFEGTLEALGKL